MGERFHARIMHSFFVCVLNDSSVVIGLCVAHYKLQADILRFNLASIYCKMLSFASHLST